MSNVTPPPPIDYRPAGAQRDPQGREPFARQFLIGIGGGSLVSVILWLLEVYVSGPAGVWYLVVLGGIAIGVALFLPRGIWGAVRDRFNLQLLPVGYRLRS